MKRAAPAKKKSPPKAGGDDALLKKHEHHTAMASKHRAHADLIEAKLRTQGKRIGYDYGNSKNNSVSPSSAKRKIVADNDRY